MNDSHDCRWFAVLYLFTRILFLVLILVAASQLCFPLIGCVLLALLLLTALLRPYKAHSENRIDVFFLLIITFVIISIMSVYMAKRSCEV